jgi:hypothetical protein
VGIAICHDEDEVEFPGMGSDAREDRREHQPRRATRQGFGASPAGMGLAMCCFAAPVLPPPRATASGDSADAPRR